MTFDALSYLKDLGQKDDADISLIEVALALAYLKHPGISMDRYTQHVRGLIESVKSRHSDLVASEHGSDDITTRLAALKHVVSDDNEYVGDQDNYNDLQNADMMRVIDRRKGLPISLGILYISIGRALGWGVQGLNMPGHFVCRLEMDGNRVVFDPFYNAKILDAASLRTQIKEAMGQDAELSAEYFEPASNRDILIRLQNNIKLRLIESEAYDEALEVIETMRLISPSEFRLLLDAGVLYAKTEKPMAAIRALEGYIEKAPNAQDREDARQFLQDVRRLLN